MAPRMLFAAVAAFSFIQHAVAQTWTYCNPMEKECPPNLALGTTNVTFDFATESANSKIWNTTAGPMKYGKAGAEFTIIERGQSPTIQSNFYIMFGSVSVMMKAAPGKGVVSSIVLQSDDLDEVDWEFLGGNDTHVETNYFGKGNTTSFDRAIYHPISPGPISAWHNYTVTWTKDKIDWYVDEKLLRTLKYEEANGGNNFPQTPMNVRLGIWVGGDPKNPPGTIEWAGGLTDFKDVPYTMFISNLTVSDYSKGSEYYYSDRSGSWQSIKSKLGNSTVVAELHKPHGVSGHWKALPAGTRSAIITCSIGGFGLLVAGLLGFCFWQGRKGAKEKKVADAAWEKEQAEFNQYRMKMIKGGFANQSKPV